MKKKSIISLFAFLLGFGVTTTSCEDMLTPDMDRYAEGFTGRDTVNFYLGILANVQGVIENNVILGEVRSDLASPTKFVSDTVSQIANFQQVPDAENGLVNRAAYYKVINQCNFYLAKADTMAMKNNIYYMRKEFAQVQFIRAWTYMQLVQLYGEVPFIAEPVDNAGTGWEKDPEMGGKPRANADNLLEMLQKEGLETAYLYEKTLGYPNYGTFNNGKVSIPHRQTLFPGDLVMADLYLLRGRDKSDFENAAGYYYTYLKNNKLTVNQGASASFSKETIGDDEYYHPNGNNWASKVVSLNATDGAITLVPSAANSSIGKTLTRVQQLYGFDPRSSNQTSSEGAVSGNISITANYKNRQIAPAFGYKNLCKAQIVAKPKMSNNVEIDVEYPENLGDCRIDGTFKYVKTLDMLSSDSEGGRIPFIQKFGNRSSNQEADLSAFSFRYALPVYRVNQVYLRYAEAINRAGYPRFAFSVLRNGLKHDNVPELRTDSTFHDDVNKISYTNIPYAGLIADGNFCISKKELMDAATAIAPATGERYLDFSETYWTNAGIHSLGCGKFTDKDTLFTYDLRVLGIGYDNLTKLPEGIKKEDLLSRIAQENQRVNGGAATTSHIALLGGEEGEGEQEGDTTEIDRTDYTIINVSDSLAINPNHPLVPAEFKPVAPENELAEINAVETLIADEMALETAYEGWRYFDLYRIARHKNFDSANYGTQWFAWLVARRDADLKYYQNPSDKGNAELYDRLCNMNNWYLANPQ